MIDFPSNPVVGSVFTSGGQQWTWDGVKWLPSGQAAAFVPAMNDNRIINGDMRIDQRNNGASGTASNSYGIDRWAYVGSQANTLKAGRNLNAIAGPIGFPYYWGFQSLSAYTSVAADYFEIYQPIEADMVSDFAFGTANAQPVTLSFWVQSSKTGMFSGSIMNYASTRAYPFSFSIPTANTWARIVITIPGDTAGSWVVSGNSGSVYVVFDLGSGSGHLAPAGAWINGNISGVNGTQSIVATNGATFYLTGVKLEIGSVATPFNRYSLSKCLADCQRYYETSYDGVNPGTANHVGSQFNMQLGGLANTTNNAGSSVQFKAAKRALPTITYYSPITGASGRVRDAVNGVDVTVASNIGVSGLSWWATPSVASIYYNTAGHWTANAEL